MNFSKMLSHPFLMSRRFFSAFVLFCVLLLPAIVAKAAVKTLPREALDDIHWCAQALQIPALRVVSSSAASPDLDVTDENALLVSSSIDSENISREKLEYAGSEKWAGVCVVQESLQSLEELRVAFPATKLVVRNR